MVIVVSKTVYAEGRGDQTQGMCTETVSWKKKSCFWAGKMSVFLKY